MSLNDQAETFISAYRDLIDCLGFYQNGTCRAVTIAQNDVSPYDWIVTSGTKSSYGDTLEEALSNHSKLVKD